ncbi:helix-turn-helix domain-containing protein [Enterobacter hormaechei]|uniref:helix-turn-helix domain-containing protein n=1 Tax=Enterobacter hormaechei TaxID=158836 RepID=UPI003D6FCA4F
MKGKNRGEVSFDEHSKETIQDRLKQLIGDRSLRAVATSWNLPYSTLNNYLSRGTEPSLRAMQQVAEAEGISLDWLASGLNEKQKRSSLETEVTERTQSLRTVWGAIFDSLPANDIEALVKLIHRKGTEGILSLETSPVQPGSAENRTESPQVKQLIELINTCDDAQIREILHSVANLKSTTLPGSESVSQVSKKAG